MIKSSPMPSDGARLESCGDTQESPQFVDQSLEPMRHKLQRQVDQTMQDLKQERDKPPQTSLQQVMTPTMKALKATLERVLAPADTET